MIVTPKSLIIILADTILRLFLELRFSDYLRAIHEAFPRLMVLSVIKFKENL